jgi:CheY-like chemotaxis protein
LRKTFFTKKESIMKILVIDDSPIHQDAARAQLKDHDLTVVGTYDEAQALLEKEHYFEVVLADLLLPASEQQQNIGSALVGQEMPVGIFLALLAARNGAKYVSVFTDANHHEHPASACFDPFNPRGAFDPTTFTVEGAKVLLCNDKNLVEAFYKEDLSKVMDWGEYFRDRGKAEEITVSAKNWRELLERLINI